MSNAIRHLEDQIGIKLFERIANRMVPTAEANALHCDAEPLQAMSEAVERRILDLREMKTGRLRILSTHAVSRTIVAEGLARFMENRSRIQVFFDVRRMEGVIESVESGFVDLGIALSPARRPGMEILPLIDGRLVVICPRQHAFATRDAICASDLKTERFIGLEPASQIGRLVRSTFDTAKVSYQPMIEVRHCVTACALVEKGLGIAIVDQFSAGPWGHWDFAVRPFAPTVPVVVSVMYLGNRPLSRIASQFVDELRTLPQPGLDHNHQE